MSARHRAEPGIIRALGTLAYESDARLRPRPLLLLVYLGLEGPTPRGRLASLFCDGASDPADALVTTLRRARAGLADASHGAQVATVLGSDALAFRTAALSGDDERAVTFYRGPFLDGLTTGMGTDLEEWCFRTREDLAGLAVMAHLRLAREALARGSRANCLKHAMAVLRHAPAGTLDGARVATLRRVLRDADLLLPGLWSQAVGSGPIVRRHQGSASRRSKALGSRCELRAAGWHDLADDLRSLARAVAREAPRSWSAARATRT